MRAEVPRPQLWGGSRPDVRGWGNCVNDRNTALISAFYDASARRDAGDFDFGHWSKTAPGRPVGLLFGWTPMFRATIRGRTMQSLEEFMNTG